MLRKQNLILISLLLAAIIPAAAEVFRTQKTVVIAASENPTETKKVGINSCVSVSLPEDLTFVHGIEILVKIPAALANYRNTILYSLYDDVAPVPSEKEIDYSGKNIYSGLYPGQHYWSIIVPLVKNNKFKASPYSDKTLVPNSSRGFIFLRNQLAMKGLPVTALEAEFEVSAKILYSDYGALKINATQNDYSVIVDEATVKADSNGLIFLKPGKHNVTVVSENFRNETRTVIIEQAKITGLTLNLKSVEPTFTVNAPQGTRIFVDGKEVFDINSLKLESGNHTLRFVLGGYEVVKNVDIQNGKSYNISVNFDANISVEE